MLEELSETRLFKLSSLTSHLPLSTVTSYMKKISSISSKGNKPYGHKFERVNGKTGVILYHHSDMAPISIMIQHIFYHGSTQFWRLVPKTVVNRYASHVCKKNT